MTAPLKMRSYSQTRLTVRYIVSDPSSVGSHLPSAPSEAELIAASQRGELVAFNRLVELHQAAIFNHAARMLGSIPAAEDAAQETFIAAFKNIKAYRGGSFKGWLFRIATNTCYDQLRQKQRRPGASLDEYLENPNFQPPSAAAGPEEQALSAELARELQRAIATLPEDQRTVLLLSDVEGLSYEEVAEASGCSLGTVKSRLSRARGRVREELRTKRELLPGWLRLTTESES